MAQLRSENVRRPHLRTLAFRRLRPTIRNGSILLRRSSTILVSIGIALALALTSCLGSDSERGERSGESESGEHSRGSESGEHNESSESGEHSSGPESDGEESGTQFTLSETFDEVRAGARLVLSYDSNANAFIGRVENTTGSALRQVRVEVHLSNGTELGPTTPVDLAPGEVVDITLPATSQPFASWSAHPEVD